MVLSKNNELPLYKRVADAMRTAISDGTYKPGDKIPSEDKLCKHFNVSRVTLRAAMGILVDDGTLKRRHGIGTFVKSPVIVETQSGGSFTRLCRQMNAVPKTEVIHKDVPKATEDVAKHLGIDAGENVCRITRARYINDMAAIFEIDYFRGTDDFILTADVTEAPIAEAIQKNTGLSAAGFKDSFDVARATDDMAAIFKCPVGTSLLLVKQMVQAMDGQILYYNQQYILSDRYKYVVSYV